MFSLAWKNGIIVLLIIFILHILITRHLDKKYVYQMSQMSQMSQMQLQLTHAPQHETEVEALQSNQPNQPNQIQKDEDELFNFIKECAKPLSSTPAPLLAESTAMQTNALGSSMGTFSRCDYAPF